MEEGADFYKKLRRAYPAEDAAAGGKTAARVYLSQPNFTFVPGSTALPFSKKAKCRWLS